MCRFTELLVLSDPELSKAADPVPIEYLSHADRYTTELKKSSLFISKVLQSRSLTTVKQPTERLVPSFFVGKRSNVKLRTNPLICSIKGGINSCATVLPEHRLEGRASRDFTFRHVYPGYIKSRDGGTAGQMAPEG